jgi:hypothetical protein
VNASHECKSQHRHDHSTTRTDMTTMTTREAWHQRSRSSRATSKAAFIVAALLFAFGAIPLDTATAAPEMAPTAPGRPSNSSNPAWHGEEYCSLHGSHDVGPSVHLRSRKTMKTYPRTHWRRAFLPYGGPVVWAVLREPRPGQTVWIEWLRPHPPRRSVAPSRRTPTRTTTGSRSATPLASTRSCTTSTGSACRTQYQPARRVPPGRTSPR